MINFELGTLPEIKTMKFLAGDVVHFEGEITEKVIAGLLHQLDAYPNTSRTVINRLKMLVIELCTNIITHHSGTPFGSLDIESVNGSYQLSVSSFLNKNDLDIINVTLAGLRANEDINRHYQELLGNIGQSNQSVKLGLAKVYSISKGQMNIETKTIASKILLTFKLTVHDHH